MKTKLLALSAVLLLAFAVSPLSSARAGTPVAAPPQPAELKWQPGPAKVSLGHSITIDLPEAYVFLGAADAKKLLAKSGNFEGDDFLGIVVPKDENARWWVALSYDEDGHVKDDEKIDAQALLDSMKKGTEESNKEREKGGFPPLHVDDWVTPPTYDSVLHHLVWALAAHSDRGQSINFNTRVLGRRGVVSVNLITSPDTLEADKPAASALLAATTFDGGARYGDFDSKTDKVATYGLMGLIAGGAGLAALKVAKVGLLVKFGKVILLGLVKFGKAIALAFVAFFGFLKRLVTGKPKPESAAPPSMVNQAGDPPVVTQQTHRDASDDEGEPPGTT